MQFKSGYTFRRAEAGEAAAVFGLILERIAWMDRRGFRQWNSEGYQQFYSLAYFQEQQRLGTLYVLADRSGAEIVSAGVLLETDSRWPDGAPALYLHNFVSRCQRPGAGSRFLEEAGALAAARGKKYLRLDSLAGNEDLAAYYAARGFVPAGTCREGDYCGILRQKPLG